MNEIISYILKSNILILVILGIYSISIKTTTFHQLKRWYLLLGIIASLLLPFITIQEIEYIPINTIAETITNDIGKKGLLTPELIILITVVSIYIIGFILFTIRFIKGIIGIRKIISKSSKFQNHNYVFQNEVITNPFSLLTSIYINPDNILINDLPNIIQHESIHIQHKHIIDKWFIQVIQIIFWFNPFIKEYASSIEENHEWIVDEEMKLYTAPDVYQLQLLRYQTFQAMDLANLFAYSPLKKRIHFMNRQPSSKWKSATLLIAAAGIIGTTYAINYEKSHQYIFTSHNNELKESLNNATNENFIHPNIQEYSTNLISNEINNVVEHDTNQTKKSKEKITISNNDVLVFKDSNVRKNQYAYDTTVLNDPENGQEIVVVSKKEVKELNIDQSMGELLIQQLQEFNFDEKQKNNLKIKINDKFKIVGINDINKAHVKEMKFSFGDNDSKEAIIYIKPEFEHLYN